MHHPKSSSKDVNLTGPTWAVDAQPDPTSVDGRYTFVCRTAADGRSARSWMGGPKLYGDDVVNVWAAR